MEGFSNMVIRLSHLFVSINSLLNIGIYYMIGEKFRNAWRDAWTEMTACGRRRGMMAVSRDVEGGSGGGGGVPAQASLRTVTTTTTTRMAVTTTTVAATATADETFHV